MKLPDALFRWLPRDTLALRLFLLLWAALVLSHVVAWGVTTRWLDLTPPPGQARAGPGGPGGPRGAPPMPTFPSLPPTPGLGTGHGPGPGGGLPMPALILDYGVRLLLIALAAWWGSRWLARPVARLVRSSQALGPSLEQGQPPPRLDEQHGTVEVRAAAAVFNRMSVQIKQQFDARGLMIAAISHDLRTPLTRMRLRVETADIPDTLRQRCTADLQEMNALIDTVLEVFRHAGPSAKTQRTDIASLVQALLDDRQEHGADVSLQAEPVVTRTEPVALRRVVGNLVDNALRYAGHAHVQVVTEPGNLHIRVEDRGPGIPPDQLTQVLQPFVRVEGSRQASTGGTGLGLFIAHELTRRLGGQLALANRPGGGLSACVTLPRLD